MTRFVEQYNMYYCDGCAIWLQTAPAQQQSFVQVAPASSSVVSSGYTVSGTIIPYVIYNLNSGQSIRVQPGAMIYRDVSVQMQTKTHGGLMKGLGRKMLGGESMSMGEYTGPGKVVLSGGVPGKIVPIMLQGNALRTKSGAFIACDSSVEMEVTSEKIGTAIIGGVGLFQLRFYGMGTAFIQAKGDVIEGTLQAGQEILVDEDGFLACDESLTRSRQRVEGVRNILTGGEGMYLLKMTGPGRYWLETGGGFIQWIKSIAQN